MTSVDQIFAGVIGVLVSHHNVYWYNLNTEVSSAYDLWEVLGLSKEAFRSLLHQLNWLKMRTTPEGERIFKFNPDAIKLFISTHFDSPRQIDHSRAKPIGFKTPSHFLRVGSFKEDSFNACKQFATITGHGSGRQRLPRIASNAHAKALKASILPLVPIPSVEVTHDAATTEANPSEHTNNDQLADQKRFAARLIDCTQRVFDTLTPDELSDINSQSDDSFIESLAGVIMRKKHVACANKISMILGQNTHPTNERLNTPKLDQYLVPNDSREHELLFQELLLHYQRLNPTRFVVGSVASANNKTRSLLIIPKNRDVQVNQNLLKELLDCSYLDMDIIVQSCCRLNKDAFVEALTKKRLSPPKQLTTEQLAGLMKGMNLSMTQARTMRRLLHLWLGCSVFPSERKMSVAFANDGFNPYTATVLIDGRRFHYSYKLPHELLEFHLVRVLESLYDDKEQVTRTIKRIELVVLADHGKEHFRMITTMLFYSEQDLLHRLYLTTGDIKTTEDSVRMMRETFVGKVNESMRQIEEAKTIVVRADESIPGSYMSSLSTTDEDVENMPVLCELPVRCHLNGDIKFLANCLGKERMSGKHCYLCRLSAKQWAVENHEPGMRWTQPSLKAKWQSILTAMENEESMTPSFVNGVTGPAIIDSIPTSRIGVPQLHIELGIGNQILFKRIIEKWIVPFFVRLSDEVYGCRVDYYRRKKALSEAVGPTAKKEAKKELAEATKALKDALKDTKHMNDPVIIHIEENILHKFNIKRSAYHGGDPEGNACRSLFSNADEALSEVAQYLKGISRVFPITDVDIDLFFNANIRLLHHYDAIVSVSRKIGPSLVEVATCESHVRRFCSLWRKLGYSVEMVKFHLIEDHLIEAISKGNAARLEDGMELHHQVASKYEQRSSQRDGPQKHINYHNAEKRDSNPKVEAVVTEALETTGRKRVREANELGRQQKRQQKNARRSIILGLSELQKEDCFDVEKYIIDRL